MKKYREKIIKLIKRLPKIMPDILAISGSVSISFGCYKIIEPLGYIVMGVLLIGGAVIWSKS